MKKIVMILTAMAVLACAVPAYACTGFAVYGDTPIYGMNFDYPPTEVRLVIQENGGIPRFVMQFIQGGSYQPTVGMNDQGLFASVQMQYPEMGSQESQGEGELFVGNLLGCLDACGTVEDVRVFLEDKRLIQMYGLTLHTLMADPAGDAMIAETGDTHNEIIPMEGDFIVMTNFTNADFRDTPYDQINGVGAGRYITAYEYIRENRDDFGIDEALACLRATTQEGGYPTLCSMAFAPEEDCVYVALHRDFDAIWKISIPGKTIETYRGFDKNMKFNMPDDGVLASDLMAGHYDKYEPVQAAEGTGTAETDAQAPETHTRSSSGQTQGLTYIAIVLAAAAIAASSMVMQKKRQKAQDKRPRRRL